MSDEEKEKVSLMDGLRNMASHTRYSPTYNDQVVRAGLAGTCIAFLIAIFAQPSLYKSLTTPLYAFAIGLPVLVFCYWMRTTETINTRNHDTSFEIQTLRIFDTTIGIFTAIGYLAVAVGVGLIISYMSRNAAYVFGLTIAAMVVLSLVIPAVTGATANREQIQQKKLTMRSEAHKSK